MNNINVSQTGNTYTCTKKIATSRSSKIGSRVVTLTLVVENEKVYVMRGDKKYPCAYPASGFTAADANRIALVSQFMHLAAVSVKPLSN